MRKSKAALIALLIAFTILSQSGCSGGGGQKASEAVPDTKVLEPVKEAVEKAEDEMERRQEAKEREQEEKIEGFFEEAEKLSDHAFSLRDRNDWEGYIEALDRLIELRLKALHYAEEEGLDRERGRAHRRLGRTYEKRGRMKEAEEHYKKALEFATDDSERGFVYDNLFELYRQTSRLDEASELIPLAAPLAKGMEGRTKWSLAPAKIALRQKQLESAEKITRAFLESVQGQESQEALAAQMECYEMLIDLAWERENRGEAAKLRVLRSEISLEHAKMRLREIQGSKES